MALFNRGAAGVRRGRTLEVGWIVQPGLASAVWFEPQPFRRDNGPPPSAKAVQNCPAVVDFDARHFVVPCPVDLDIALAGTRTVSWRCAISTGRTARWPPPGRGGMDARAGAVLPEHRRRDQLCEAHLLAVPAGRQAPPGQAAEEKGAVGAATGLGWTVCRFRGQATVDHVNTVCWRQDRVAADDPSVLHLNQVSPHVPLPDYRCAAIRPKQ